MDKLLKVISKITNIGIEGTKTYIESKGSLIATASAVSSSVLQDIVETGTDYLTRQLSQTEERRVAQCLEHIQSRISAQIVSGKVVNYNLFKKTNEERAPSTELLEGVLQKCRWEYEEKKLIYTSNIYANVVFDNEPMDENFSKDEAHFRIMIAEKLTYRQLCFLSLLSNVERVRALKFDDYVPGYKNQIIRAVLLEIYELYNLGLVENYNYKNGRAESLQGILSIRPSSLKLTNNGKRQVMIMDLNSIESADIEAVLNLLSR